MHGEIIKIEKSGCLILGKFIQRSPALLDVQIIYPYYGIRLKAQPKMCMLFSEKTMNKFGEKMLDRCYYLGKLIEKRNTEIAEDFKKLQEVLKDYSLPENYERKTKLPEELENFRKSYLNGFQKVPEFLLNPLEALISYLENYFETHPYAKKVQPETEFSDQAEYVEKLLKKIQF